MKQAILILLTITLTVGQLLLSSCRRDDQLPNRVQTIENLPEDIALEQIAFDLQGHRGARGLVPENTIPSFLKALELGVNTLELDVVVSQDGVIVVSHEPFLNPKICLNSQGDSIRLDEGEQYNLYQMTLAEIQKCDCGSLGNPDFPEQKAQKTHKPSLAEVVKAAEKFREKNDLAHFFYNIETKSKPETDSIFHPKPEVFAKLLYQNLKEFDIIERVYVQSFDVRTLQEFRKIDETLRLVLLSENALTWKQDLQKLGFSPSVYSPNYRNLNREIVRVIQDKGIKVIPWTVNSIEDMRRIRKLGVDGLITDYPNRFVETFRTAPKG